MPLMTRFVVAALVAAVGVAVLSAQQPVPQVEPDTPAPAEQSAQDQPPLTFRVEVNYVEVDAVVTDAQGNFVTDLTADDFELFEDREQQEISAFSLVSLPVERGEQPLFAAEPIEPDVTTNTTAEGRLYLIVLDSWHTQPANVPKVKAIARQFIDENFGANDMAAVVFTGGQSRDTQDFTGSRRLLLNAVDKLRGLKGPGATLARTLEASSRPARAPGLPVSDPAEFERAFLARSAMERIRTLSEFMAGVRGRRKAMLLFGEGVEYNFFDILSDTQASGVLEVARDTIGAATRSNVAIYAIDPRGLAVPDQALVVSGSSPGADDPSLGDLGGRSIAREFRMSQESLRMLSDETGGFAVLNQNEFTSAFARIVEANSNYYVLGYYSTNERRDGRFRTINVSVNRPGVVVRARRGYVAARGRAPDEPEPTEATVPAVTLAVNDAIGSPIPISGVPLRVAAAPFRGPDSDATVALAIEFDVNDFTFTEIDGVFNNRVEVAFTSTDIEGDLKGGDRQTLTMNMRPETLARARERGFRVASQIDLEPGRYQLRVGAAEEGGKAGSVLYDLEVPDFDRESLTMSGVALTSVLSANIPTALSNNPLEQFLPGPLTATREFSRDDELALFVEFYENARNLPPHRLDLSTTVRSEDGRVLFENREERDSSELAGGRGGYGYQSRIPLEGLGLGRFVVHVEGRFRIGDEERGVGRDVLIRVRE